MFGVWLCLLWCLPRPLIREWTSLARLETRTKEFYIRASRRGSKPPRHSESNTQLHRWGSIWVLAPGLEREHGCNDPKDSELCVFRMKSDESLMEVRSDTDVQIVRRRCV